MYKKFPKIITALVVLLLALVFVSLRPGQTHAETLSETATESWDATNCIGSVNGAQTSYFGVASGDNVDLTVSNTSSTETLAITIYSNGSSVDTFNVSPNGTHENTYTDSGVLQVYATDNGCNAKADFSSLNIEGASGTLSCASSDGGKVWNVTGNFSNVVPLIYMYKDSTYVADITATNNSVSVDEQFSSESSVATYYLYNGTSSSDRQIGVASCPAASTPAANTTGGSSTASKTSTPSSSATTKSQTTTDKSYTAATPLGYSATSGKYHPSLGSIIPIIIAALVITIFEVICLGLVFIKAGKPGWAAVVPFYNSWILYEMGGIPGWWVLLSLIPIVNIVALVMLAIADIEIAKRFGKNAWYGFFLLFLFSFIGYPILALSKAKYTLPHTANKPQQQS